MPAYYNEHDEFASGWLRNLIAEGLIARGDVDTRSIVDVHPDDLRGYTQCHFFAGIGGWSYALRLAGIPDDRPLWTGSCPCQPFSLAGQQRGFADERHLWPVWRGLIAERRPARVFGEQVASATEWLRLVRGDLEALGYAVGAIPFEAASAGADHLRNRYGIVAVELGHARGAGLAFGRPVSEIQRRNVRHKGPAIGASSDRGDGLADADRDGIWDQPGRGGGASGSGTGQHRDDSKNRDVGIADGAGWIEGQPPGAPSRYGSAAVATGSGDVAHSEVERRPYRDGGQVQGSAERERPQEQSERCRGYDGFEWVIGADGKARRVKPGIRLLADGFPNRVGLLRGFGNAIDPRAFAQFIAAADEAVGDYVRSAGCG